MTAYSIPSSNFATLGNEISKFNKKNAKFGELPIIATKIGTEFKKIENSYIQYTDFSIEGNIPVINGWKIIAKIDHLNGMNIIHKFSDITLPEEFLTRKPYCDHCNTYKIKVNSVLIQNKETGEFKHVGKTCLKDFFNCGIEGVISKLSFIAGLMDDIESEYDSIGGSCEHHFEFNEVLTVAFCSIRQWGYRKSSEEGSTKNSINTYYGSGHSYFDITTEDVNNGIEALSWLENQNNNEFFNNLKNMVKMVYIPYKYFGYVAGLAGAYLKSKNEKNENKEFTNEYVGTIGKREVFNVTLLVKMAVESFYGVSYLHIFLDNTGHKLSWFSTAGSDAEINNTYTIKGTVKKHEEYKGTKQTSLSRVTFIG